VGGERKRERLCIIFRGVEIESDDYLFLDANGLARHGADDGVARFELIGGVEVAGHFVTNEVGESFHLRLHLGHFVAHVENNFDAGEIDAEFAGEIEDDFEAFEIFVGVEARVALGARGLQQADTLIEAERLRVEFVDLRDRADHVTGFGFLSCFGDHAAIPFCLETLSQNLPG